ncbi:hypothetical protein BC6307_19940 [Sutcliffiella cohnii]|uniref:Uncharacterized protein n=1 Tax=Sutcliffiella cohnii TaxID=33932 RepID=A0A223KV55_9BACI|nr:hypothetical protein [Sutcliffiella cohnii]AST93371.1 hypothetical protein BC6307_19940 [Sutcliffiella cohnii]
MKNLITIGLLFLLVLNSVGTKTEYEGYSPLTSATKEQTEQVVSTAEVSVNKAEEDTESEQEQAESTVDSTVKEETKESEQDQAESSVDTEEETATETELPNTRAFTGEDGKFYVKNSPTDSEAITVGDTVERVKSVFGEPNYIEQDELYSLEDMLVYEYSTGESTIIRINHQGYADFMMVFSNSPIINENYLQPFKGDIYKISGEYWMYYLLNDVDQSLATYSMENNMYTLKLFSKDHYVEEELQFSLDMAKKIMKDQW